MAFRFEPITSPPFQPPSTSGSEFTIPSTSGFAPMQTPSPSNKYLAASGAYERNLSINSAARSNSDKFSTSSLALSCLSPDGLSVHSLLCNGTIVTRFLPLHESEEGAEASSSAYEYTEEKEMMLKSNSGNKRNIKSITTTLPPHMVQSFTVDAPIEIICIDNDTAPESSSSSITSLPLLCIYSQSSANVLKIQYEEPQSLSSRPIEITGTIQHIHEPFESYLTASGSNIKRIRPAPHSYARNGSLYETLCSKGAMIMLSTAPCSASNSSTSASIVLFHGYNDSSLETYGDITIPATIHPEQVDQTSIVDLCFLPSVSPSVSSPAEDHAIWNAMTIVTCTEQGGLYALSPIVFHNTVFPKSQVDNAQTMLQQVIVRCEHTISKRPEYRRAKAAQQYFKDLFGPSSMKATGNSGQGHYVKANILNQRGYSATMWNVGVQNLYFGMEEADYEVSGVECIEVIAPSPSLVGQDGTGTVSSNVTSLSGCMNTIVVARQNSIEYVMIPCGENVLPIFKFDTPEFEKEQGADMGYFNQILYDSAWMVERATLDNLADDREEEKDGYCDAKITPGGGRAYILIPDAVDNTMMHYVRNDGVVTVTTNAISVMERKLIRLMYDRTDIDEREEPRTNAWYSVGFDTSGGKKSSSILNGVVVCSDAQLGHVLLAILADGSTEAVNMTAAQYLNEAKKSCEYKSELGKLDVSKESCEALKAMESMPPLYKQIEPYFDQISAGLSKMNKIAGGSTDPKKITPGALATFLSTKQASEENIILRLKQLNTLTVSRMKYLKSLRQHQLLQLEQIRTVVETLQERMKATAENKTILEANMKLLSERSAAVLINARELTPTITEAEHQYFKDVRRCETNCGKWESALEEIRDQYATLRESARHGMATVQLSEQQKVMCETLLQGQGEMLQGMRSRVKDMEFKTDRIILAQGLEDKRKPFKAIGDENK